MTHAYQGGEWYAPPELTVDDYLRPAVLSVLDAEDALRAAGVRSENAPKLLDALRHAVARINAVNKALRTDDLRRLTRPNLGVSLTYVSEMLEEIVKRSDLFVSLRAAYETSVFQGWRRGLPFGGPAGMAGRDAVTWSAR